jgi:heme/copper-type cytochrome/quinol oxidase subunit 2
MSERFEERKRTNHALMNESDEIFRPRRTFVARVNFVLSGKSVWANWAKKIAKDKGATSLKILLVVVILLFLFFCFFFFFFLFSQRARKSQRGEKREVAL